MNDDQRKMLTELLVECDHEWNPAYQDGRNFHIGVSDPPMCLKCDYTGAYGTNRTFLTGNDLIAVKDALVKEGLWGEFKEWVYHYWVQRVTLKGQYFDKDDWLFRPVAKNGGPHFARLVAEFLEGRKD